MRVLEPDSGVRAAVFRLFERFRWMQLGKIPAYPKGLSTRLLCPLGSTFADTARRRLLREDLGTHQVWIRCIERSPQIFNSTDCNSRDL